MFVVVNVLKVILHIIELILCVMRHFLHSELVCIGVVLVTICGDPAATRAMYHS
jgi:hypothetical protein